LAAAIRLSQQHSCSLDHLVGAAKQRERDSKTKRFGGYGIDYQIIFRWKDYGEISRLFPFENPAPLGSLGFINGRLLIVNRIVRTVTGHGSPGSMRDPLDTLGDSMTALSVS
jgi:hypothetical protein